MVYLAALPVQTLDAIVASRVQDEADTLAVIPQEVELDCEQVDLETSRSLEAPMLRRFDHEHGVLLLLLSHAPLTFCGAALHGPVETSCLLRVSLWVVQAAVAVPAKLECNGRT